jgi:hypothetical protein
MDLLFAIALYFSIQQQLGAGGLDFGHFEQEQPIVIKTERLPEEQTQGIVPDSLCPLLESSARDSSLPLDFFLRLIWHESGFRAGAIGPLTRSGKRALGIAQFMPGTATEQGVSDPFEPAQALPRSAAFLRELKENFGNLGLAAAAYNAGPQRLRDWLSRRGNIPAETRRYVKAITGAPIEAWALSGREWQLQTPGSCALIIASLRAKTGAQTRVRRTTQQSTQVRSGSLPYRTTAAASRSPWRPGMPSAQFWADHEKRVSVLASNVRQRWARSKLAQK